MEFTISIKLIGNILSLGTFFPKFIENKSVCRIICMEANPGTTEQKSLIVWEYCVSKADGKKTITANKAID